MVHVLKLMSLGTEVATIRRFFSGALHLFCLMFKYFDADESCAFTVEWF